MFIAMIREIVRRLSQFRPAQLRSERARRKAREVVKQLPPAIQQDIGWPRFADQCITNSHSNNKKHSFD